MTFFRLTKLRENNHAKLAGEIDILLLGHVIKNQIAGYARILETFWVVQGSDSPHVMQLHLRFICKPFAIPVYEDKSLAWNPGLEAASYSGALKPSCPTIPSICHIAAPAF
jgi:hypothetical protein